MGEPQLVDKDFCNERSGTIAKNVEKNTENIEKLTEFSIRMATIIEMKESSASGFLNTKAGMMILRLLIVAFAVLLSISVGINMLPMI